MRRGLSILAVAALAACSRTDPPVLSLGDRVCDAQPALETAIPVPMGDMSGAMATLSMTSRCLTGEQPGRPSVTYAAFRLPSTAQSYTLTVASLANNQTVVRPHLTVLGEAGDIRRTVMPDDVRADVSGYHAGLRLGSDDRTLVVSADPAHLGERVKLRLSLVSPAGVQVAASVPIPIYIYQPPPPVLTSRDTTIALNGTIRVSAQPLDVIAPAKHP